MIFRPEIKAWMVKNKTALPSALSSCGFLETHDAVGQIFDSFLRER